VIGLAVLINIITFAQRDMNRLKLFAVLLAVIFLYTAHAEALNYRSNYSSNPKVSKFLKAKGFDAGILYDLGRNKYGMSFRFRGSGYRWYVNKRITAGASGRVPLPVNTGVYSLRIANRGSYIESFKACLEISDKKEDIKWFKDKYASILGTPFEEYSRDGGETYRAYYYIIHNGKYINMVFTVAYKEEIKKTIVTTELIYKGRYSRRRLNYY